MYLQRCSGIVEFHRVTEISIHLADESQRRLQTFTRQSQNRDEREQRSFYTLLPTSLIVIILLYLLLPQENTDRQLFQVHHDGTTISEVHLLWI